MSAASVVDTIPSEEPFAYSSTLQETLEWTGTAALASKQLRRLYTLRRTVDAAFLKVAANHYGETEAAAAIEAVFKPAAWTGDVNLPSGNGLIPFWVLLNVVVALCDEFSGRHRSEPGLNHRSLELALPLASSLADKALALATSDSDALVARGVFHYARVYELAGRAAETKPILLRAFQRGKLHRLSELQATSANCVLRLLLSTGSFTEATQFALLAPFPNDYQSVSSFARYLLLIGTIQALRADYEDAILKVKLAIRKTDNRGAFLRRALRLLVVLELITGGLPARSLFQSDQMQEYRQLVIAVRDGELHEYSKVVETNKAAYQRHGTFSLVLRLRQTVLRTGLKHIARAYDRIPLADVCAKLGLDSIAEAETVVCQGIADGVLSGTVDHETKILNCRTSEVRFSAAAELNRRVQMALTLHEEALVSVPYDVEEEDADEKTKQLEQERKENEERLLMVEDGELFEFDDFE